MKKIDTLLEQARAEKKEHDAKLKSFADRRHEAESRKADLTKKLDDYTDGSFEEYVETKAEIDKLTGFIELLNKQEKAFTSYRSEEEKDRWAFMKECTAVADELKADTIKKLRKPLIAILDALEEERKEHDKLLEVAYTNLLIHNVPNNKVDSMLHTVRRTSSNYEYMDIENLKAVCSGFKQSFEKKGML